MAELNAVINLKDNFSAQIRNAINGTDNFQQAVTKAREQLDKLSSEKFETTIKAKDEATKQISETRKAMNSISKNLAITIAAKDKATENVIKIKNEAKKLVSTPFKIVLEAVDKTKSVISSISSSIFNLKTLAAGIVFGAVGKEGYDWTIGNASSNEDFLATLQTVLHSEEKGKEALKWSYQDAASTPFDAKDVVSGVTMLATSGLDYEKYLNPLGDAAAAMNKPIEQAIFAMSKLKSGQFGIAVDMFRDFGISNQDWTSAGATFDKNGSLQMTDPQKAVDMVTGIIQSKYGGLMDRKSGTANGMLSNMGDTIASLGRGLAGIDDNGLTMEGGLFDNFKKQLANIAPLLEQIQGSDAFKGLQKQIGDLATIGGDKLTKFLEGFKDPEQVEKYKEVFEGFKNGVKATLSTLKDFGTVAKEVLYLVKPLIDEIAQHPKLFAGLFVGFETAKGALSVFSSIKTMGKDIVSTFKLMKVGASGFGKSFKGISPLIKGVGKDIVGFGGKIGSAFSTVVNTTRIYVGMIGKILSGNLVKAVKTGATLAGNAFKSMGKVFLSGGKSILSAVKMLATGIVAVLRPVFAFLMANPVVLVITLIIGAVVLLYEAWKHNWGGIQEKTMSVVAKIKEKISSISQVFGEVKAKVSGFVDEIKGYWDSLVSFFQHPIQGTVNIIKNFIGGDPTTGNTSVGGNALGTSYWKGGLTWVGEKGPELLDLPAGSNITSNLNSMNKLGGNKVDVSVNIQGNVIGNEEYANYIGETVAYKVNTLLATNM